MHDIRLPLPKESLRDVDYVLHYAAVNGTQYFYEKPELVLDVNVTGTINVIKASIDSNVKKIVFASSSEVYGSPLVYPTPETHPIILPDVNNPRHSYAASKVIGEFYIRWMCEKYGVKYLILRIFNAYGPRMDTSKYGQVIPEFIRKLFYDREFTIIGPGTQTRSFCYITDNVELTFRAMLKVDNEILNVGNDKEVTILELAKIMHEIVGRKFEPKILPPRPGDPMRRVPDIRKIVSLTGYRPMVSLREGLRNTIKWYAERWGFYVKL